MKHCPDCGAGARREGAKFCEECGFRLAVDGAAPEPPPVVAGESASLSGQEPVVQVAPDTVTLSLPPRAVLWASTLLLFAVFFPWLMSTARISNAMGIPVELLWNQSASTGGFALGWVLVILAILVTIASVVRGLSAVRRLLGVVAMLLPITLVVQWTLALDSLGSADSWLSYIGLGAYATLTAGGIVAFAPQRGA